LGADTRATDGSTVADKNCEKIHYIAPNIYCCGAGTAADTENTTNLISGQLHLHRLATGRESRLATACKTLKQMLFKYDRVHLQSLSMTCFAGQCIMAPPHSKLIFTVDKRVWCISTAGKVRKAAGTE
jgi:20S proteasome alpha/beta subunit